MSLIAATFRAALVSTATLALSACFLPAPAGTAPGASTAVQPSPVSSQVPPLPGVAVAGNGPRAPPWFAPSRDVALKQVEAAGLNALPTEGNLYHIHAYLTVFWDGAPVVVPANVGISDTFLWISPLHTHGTDGVLHVEANDAAVVHLTQFFEEWGVPMGGAMVYDDGKPVTNGPGLALRDRQTIAVVWGKPPATIPATYPFGDLGTKMPVTAPTLTPTSAPTVTVSPSATPNASPNATPSPTSSRP